MHRRDVDEIRCLLESREHFGCEASRRIALARELLPNIAITRIPYGSGRAEPLCPTSVAIVKRNPCLGGRRRRRFAWFIVRGPRRLKLLRTEAG